LAGAARRDLLRAILAAVIHQQKLDIAVPTRKAAENIEIQSLGFVVTGHNNNGFRHLRIHAFHEVD
jgi:hypothetical protein